MDIRLFLLKLIIPAIPIIVMIFLELILCAIIILIKLKVTKFALIAITAIFMLLTFIAAPNYRLPIFSRIYGDKAREAFNKNDLKECRKNMRIAFYLLDDEDQRKERCKYDFSEHEAVCFQILEEFHKEFDSKKR